MSSKGEISCVIILQWWNGQTQGWFQSWVTRNGSKSGKNCLWVEKFNICFLVKQKLFMARDKRYDSG